MKNSRLHEVSKQKWPAYRGRVLSMNAETNNGIGASARAFANSSWYLTYTRPRLETVALQNLQQQGFDAYLPLYKCLKKTDAGIQAIFVPMFPRYVFFRPSHPAQSIAPVALDPGRGAAGPVWQ